MKIEPENDRQRRLVDDYVRSRKMQDAVRRVHKPRPGSCPCCGQDNAPILATRPLADWARLERHRFVGVCALCGAVVIAGRRRLLWVHDDDELTPEQLAQVNKIRSVTPPPDGLRCPYCTRLLRIPIGGQAENRLHEAICGTCGGIFHVHEGAALPYFGLVSPKDEAESDVVRAMYIARQILIQRFFGEGLAR